MTEKSLGFHTRALHVGTSIDEQYGAVQTPIYQSVCFNFKDSQHAADLFALRTLGNIYSRLTNPTVAALADRITSLQGGAGTTIAASGHAAEILTLFALLQPGDHIVMAEKLYGGSINIARNTMPRFGWHTSFADIDDLSTFEKAITDRTKGIWVETFTNPGGQPVDLAALADIAHRHGIPLIVDNTIATPYLVRPLEFGADLVIESLTKGITGNSSTIGGAVTQGANFDWGSPKFPNLSKPLPDYNNMVLSDVFGPAAFTVFCIAVGLRDLGGALSAHSAWLSLLGSETLGVRIDRHVRNALAFAQHLKQHPHVSWVNYAGLPDSPYHDLAKRLSPKGVPSLFSFGVKGGYEVGRELVNNVELFRHVVQLTDSRSLIVHPASTTHAQVPPERRHASGSDEDVIRVSIGIEDIDDVIADFDQAIEKAVKIVGA